MKEKQEKKEEVKDTKEEKEQKEEKKAERNVKKILLKLLIEVVPMIIGVIIFNPISIESTGHGSYDFILELISFNIFTKGSVEPDPNQLGNIYNIKTFMFMNFFRLSLGRVEELFKGKI